MSQTLFVLQLTGEQMETLTDALLRAEEDFDYAAGFADNGYTPEDVETYESNMGSLRAAIADGVVVEVEG